MASLAAHEDDGFVDPFHGELVPVDQSPDEDTATQPLGQLEVSELVVDQVWHGDELRVVRPEGVDGGVVDLEAGVRDGSPYEFGLDFLGV